MRCRKIRHFLLVLVSAAMIVSLAMVLPAGAESPGEDVTVFDQELVFCETDSIGNIVKIHLYDWVSLSGDGTVDVRERKAFEEDTGWQGIHGFTTPKVEGDYIVWEGLGVDGDRNAIAVTEFTEKMVDEASMRIPLDLHYEYWFNDEKIVDPADITGKSGHFKMSLTMTNKSEESTVVEYVDPDTGEKITTEVETYLPMVIVPYDWYFDNEVFYNLNADPTGIVFYMPDFYQVGWSIPLFPPATPDSHTIWVEADVKNFHMPTLTLAVAFLFPHSNQLDPTALFKSGLEDLYEGVKQLDAGLQEALAGLGDPSTADTLLYGISRIDSGLAQMASATEGLPYAKSNLDTQIIPGVEQAAAGIGSEGTPDTLLYAVNQSTGGLQGMAAGIGDPATDNTLLYATAQMQAGLNDMLAGTNDMIDGIGDAATAGTLLNGLAQILGGLQQISASLGDRTNPATIIGGLAAISALNDPGGGALYNEVAGAYQIAAVTLPTALASLYANYGVPPGDADRVTIDNGVATQQAYLNTAAGSNGAGDLIANQIYPALEAPYPNGIIPGLEAIKANIDTGLIPGVNQVTAGLDNNDPANPGIKQGLEQIAAGIGNAATPDTLLYAVDQVTMGLNAMKAGIGSGNVPDTLLYAMAQMQFGLQQLKAGLASGDPANPGIEEGLVLISAGLGEAIAGLGSSTTPDTLLYGASQVEGGMTQMKTGLEQATTEGTSLMLDALYDNLVTLNTTEAQLEAIALRGEEFDHFLGRAEDAAGNEVRFLFQTKPTYSYKEGSSWITALVLSVIIALALILGGFLLGKRLLA